MRQTINPQMQLGEVDISTVSFNPKSRDDIPRLLRAMQYIWIDLELHRQVFNVLETMVSCWAETDNSHLLNSGLFCPYHARCEGSAHLKTGIIGRFLLNFRRGRTALS